MKSFWYIYILILVYVGGILVLFIYVTSIFPNNKFFFTQKIVLIGFVIIICKFFALIILNNFYGINLIINEFIINFSKEFPIMNIFSIKIFHFKTNLILIFLVIYLFYCILVVIKITIYINGPLRKLNYVKTNTLYTPSN